MRNKYIIILLKYLNELIDKTYEIIKIRFFKK